MLANSRYATVDRRERDKSTVSLEFCLGKVTSVLLLLRVREHQKRSLEICQ